jgi:hypothetical protein
VATRTRDPLEANAIAFKTEREQVLLVSTDLAAVPTDVCFAICDEIASRTGIPAEHVIISSTHTHAGPSVAKTNYFKEVDTEYLEVLRHKVAAVAEQAAQNLQPAQVGWGMGTARIGYNRRVCWEDGSHTMHGDMQDPKCTGLEGPSDPYLLAFFVRHLDGKLAAIFHSASSHPTSFYADEVWSADFPGESRGHLRNLFGDVPVLFFTGAQGDIAQVNQESPNRSAESRDQRCARAAHIVTGETLRLLHETRWHDNPTPAIATSMLEVDVRLPTPERLAWARELLARADRGLEENAWDLLNANGITILQDLYGDNPHDQLAIRVFRLGDVGIVTQPTELYCQFALDIKSRSPALHTMVASVTNGINGYCPTAYASLSGGYSGEAIYQARLAGDAGYKLVDESARLLCQLWGQESEKQKSRT